MHITRLLLTDLRSCAHVDLRPSPSINVLSGTNAQGKSTVLEAIYMLATSRSPRAGRDVELVRWGSDAATASVEVMRTVRAEVEVEFSLSRTEKRVMRVNQSRRARILDVVGQLNAVLFSADDLDIVRGEPSVRRRFLNLEISQISPQYCHAMMQYRRILEQRNRLLKQARETGRGTETLDAWNEQLVGIGSRLVERRLSFLAELGTHASRIHSELAGSGETLEIRYAPSFPIEPEQAVAEAFQAQLAALRADELARGMTLIGPQRDDLTFLINGADVRVYGSQGQQRTVALATKLAEVDLVRERVGEPPVLLLDDAGSELDESRRERLYSLVTGGYQTFVACTEAELLPAAILREATLFQVSAGTVSPRVHPAPA